MRIPGSVAFAGMLVAAALAGCFDATPGTPRGDVPGTATWDVAGDPEAMDLAYDPASDPAVDPAGDPATDLAIDASTDIPADGDADGLVPPLGHCGTCARDGDCAPGFSCLPVGAAKHCLATCENDADCPRSYLCYQATVDERLCLPMSYNCVACAYDQPCPDGTVCDFNTGTCKDGARECWKCTWDWDCVDGLRCHKEVGSATGACAPDCSDANPCADPANTTCTTTPKGIRLCLPNDPDTCGGCPVDRPYPAPDGSDCVECLDDWDCNHLDGEYCDLSEMPYTCVMPPCGLQLQCEDGQCADCCEDADCFAFDQAGSCVDHACVFDPCGGACGNTPYPACVTIDGFPQCVQCATDDDCRAFGPGCDSCTGHPTYTCMGADAGSCVVEECPSLCASDPDCPATPDGQPMKCSGVGYGVCFDPAGTCGSSGACCPLGTTCWDLGANIADALGMEGWPPEASPVTKCTCDDAHACFGDLPCTRTDVLCAVPNAGALLCPGGVRPDSMPEAVCGDLGLIIEALTPAARSESREGRNDVPPGTPVIIAGPRDPQVEMVPREP